MSNDEGPSKEEQPVAPGPKRIKRRIPKAVNIDDLPDEPLDEEQGSGMGPQQMNRPPMMPGGGMRPPMGMMSGGSRPPMGMMSGGSRPPMGMMSGGMRPPMGMMSGGMRPPMGMPGMGSRMGGGSRPGYGQSGAAEEEEEFKPPQYLLYRFFDFTVKPGKYYRYRVRLRMSNPNKGVPPQYLVDEASAKKPYLEDKNVWSEPTERVAVPLDSQVLAVAAKESASSPTATAMIVHFDEKDGTVSADTFDSLPRGQVLNYFKRKVKMPEGTGPLGGPGFMPGMPGAPGGMTSARPKSAKSGDKSAEGEAEPTVDYVTNTVLLDIKGGGPLPGGKNSLKEPADLLLLDQDGNLIVHNEIDDLPEKQRHDHSDENAKGSASPASPFGDMPRPGSKPGQRKGKTSSPPGVKGPGAGGYGGGAYGTDLFDTKKRK